MKVSAFKRMIMEAAKEGVIQGLQEIFENVPEQKINENFTFSSKNIPQNIQSSEEVRRNLARKMSAMFNGQNDILEEVHQPAPVANGNPYMAFLQDTANNLTFEDKQGIGNLGDVI